VRPIDEISSDVIGEAIRIHKQLGPGLLESVYETVLEAALLRKGLPVSRQVPIDIDYDGMHFAQAFRIDLLVEERLLLEIKSVEKLGKAHAKQLLTYLRLTKQPVGLLLNFSEATMMDGVVRLVNDYRPET
jgi:GxxExxY protein